MEYGITGYPTMKYIPVDRENPVMYSFSGARTLELLEDFAINGKYI